MTDPPPTDIKPSKLDKLGKLDGSLQWRVGRFNSNVVKHNNIPALRIAKCLQLQSAHEADFFALGLWITQFGVWKRLESAAWHPVQALAVHHYRTWYCLVSTCQMFSSPRMSARREPVTASTVMALVYRWVFSRSSCDRTSNQGVCVTGDPDIKLWHLKYWDYETKFAC